MSTETVAVLKLFKNWKLKSRFKFTMRNPPFDVQKKYLMEDLMGIKTLVDVSNKRLKSFPYDVCAVEAIENHLGNGSNSIFVDIDFPPLDASIYE